MKRIGAITIGQSPRVDVVPEMQQILGPDVEIVQAGVLDGLSPEEIAALAPAGNGDSEIRRLRGSPVLVSRLRDGSWVSMEEEKILPLVQKKIEQLENADVRFILMLCTGKFPENFVCRVPLIFPQKLLYSLVPQLAGRIGILTPEASQLADSRRQWGAVAQQVTVCCANPYAGAAGLAAAAEQFVKDGAEICVLDCFGYTAQMKTRLEELTGLPAILPRTLAARIAGELLA